MLSKHVRTFIHWYEVHHTVAQIMSIFCGKHFVIYGSNKPKTLEGALCRPNYITVTHIHTRCHSDGINMAQSTCVPIFLANWLNQIFYLQPSTILDKFHCRIISSTIHHEVGLVAKGAHERRAGAKHNGNTDELRLHPCCWVEQMHVFCNFFCAKHRKLPITNQKRGNIKASATYLICLLQLRQWGTLGQQLRCWWESLIELRWQCTVSSK